MKNTDKYSKNIRVTTVNLRENDLIVNSLLRAPKNKIVIFIIKKKPISTKLKPRMLFPPL